MLYGAPKPDYCLQVFSQFILIAVVPLSPTRWGTGWTPGTKTCFCLPQLCCSAAGAFTCIYHPSRTEDGSYTISPSASVWGILSISAAPLYKVREGLLCSLVSRKAICSFLHISWPRSQSVWCKLNTHLEYFPLLCAHESPWTVYLIISWVCFYVMTQE